MPNAGRDAHNLRLDNPEAALAERGPHLFFVLAAAHGSVVLLLWILAYRLRWADPIQPVMWHAHEMVYGFAAAGLAGIVAALVPNWSGRTPASCGRLGFLAALWLAGRIAMMAASFLPAWTMAAIDLAFLPTFAVLIISPVATARPARSVPLWALFLVLFAGNAAMHADALGGGTYAIAEHGARIGLDVYLLLLTAIGGRAIPYLTLCFFKSRGLRFKPRASAVLETLAIVSVAAYLAVDALAGMSTATSVVALAAALVSGIRLWLWRGYRVRGAPSLMMLHIGYLWMVVGFLLEAAAPVMGGVADMAAIHVLTAGAIGTVLLTVMTRESLIHRRLDLAGGRRIMTAYALVTLAVVLRVVALFVPGTFVNLVIASGITWAFGFLVLLTNYLPILGTVPHRLSNGPTAN
jgi:uncharacterized protein involved in response to NO